MSRLPNATRESFPEQLQYVWDRLAGDVTSSGGGLANIFLAMGNNPYVLRGYLRTGNALWAHCGLDLRTRELVILRCAELKHSMYEWHQHVRIGRDAGITDEEINALSSWKTSDLYKPSERALFAYADALSLADHPGHEAIDELRNHFDNATVVGVTILIAFYFATATFLGAMEVQTEEPFVGWQV